MPASSGLSFREFQLGADRLMAALLWPWRIAYGCLRQKKAGL